MNKAKVLIQKDKTSFSFDLKDKELIFSFDRYFTDDVTQDNDSIKWSITQRMPILEEYSSFEIWVNLKLKTGSTLADVLSEVDSVLK